MLLTFSFLEKGITFLIFVLLSLTCFAHACVGGLEAPFSPLFSYVLNQEDLISVWFTTLTVFAKTSLLLIWHTSSFYRKKLELYLFWLLYILKHSINYIKTRAGISWYWLLNDISKLGLANSLMIPSKKLNFMSADTL